MFFARTTDAAGVVATQNYTAIDVLHSSRLNIADDYASIQLLPANDIAEKCGIGAKVVWSAKVFTFCGQLRRKA